MMNFLTAPRQMLMILIAFLCWSTPAAAMTENERLEEYHRRGYVWPLNATKPNTKGWRRNQLHRIAQVEHIEQGGYKYDAWIHIMATAVVTPNFTENGWGLTRAPDHLIEELKRALHNGLPTAGEERFMKSIEGDQQPLLVPTPILNEKVLKELKPMHEEWAGVPLTGAMAYGLRAYRNNSALYMHVDKADTHIISCILHVDRSEDAEPWPIFIEDFQGNTNEVILESGDMLFYESSKCIHGRPRPFKGSWYSSLFVHYYPTGWDPKKMAMETQYAIPPSWRYVPEEDPDLEKLEMKGTSMYEPQCPDSWCGTIDTVKWYGPAKKGVVISTGYTEAEGGSGEEDEL